MVGAFMVIIYDRIRKQVQVTNDDLIHLVKL